MARETVLLLRMWPSQLTSMPCLLDFWSKTIRLLLSAIGGAGPIDIPEQAMACTTNFKHTSASTIFSLSLPKKNTLKKNQWYRYPTKSALDIVAQIRNPVSVSSSKDRLTDCITDVQEFRRTRSKMSIPYRMVPLLHLFFLILPPF